MRGDQRACAQACSIAHRAFDRMAPAGEQLWFKLFTPEYLTYEMLGMASDLGRLDNVQRLASGVLTLASAGGALRRRVLSTTDLARSYLPSPGNSRADIDQACELLSQVIPSLGSLRSTHSLGHVNALRRALAAHAGHPSVQEVEDRFHATIAAAGPPH
jgi:hypothetical protein